MDYVYKGRQNVIEKAILLDGSTFVNAPFPLDPANKIRLLMIAPNGVHTTFDSQVDDDIFSTSTIKPVRGVPVRVITMMLGAQALPDGVYHAILTVFTPLWANGVVVGEFHVSVRTVGAFENNVPVVPGSGVTITTESGIGIATESGDLLITESI